MKKLTTLAILSILLSACNKETKTITTTDPKTGKTITKEVPVAEEKPAEELAIKDTDGVFSQSLKLVKGETYPLITVQKNTQSITAPDGQKVSANSQSTDEMSFKIEDFKDGVYDITINLIGKTTSETVDGKTISISTKSAAPKEPQLKIMWAMNKALSGNTLQLKMKDNGEVVSVAGFEAIYTKMDKVATAEIKDAGQRKAFIGGFKQSFNAESFKKQFTNSLIILPKKGAKLGEKWTETENATPDGSVKLSTHYTLKSVENGLVTIAVSGGIPKKTDKQSQNGLTRTLSSELTQSGTMVLDQNTGWVKSQTITTTTNQTETITDGKQTQSMKSQNTAVINVNP